MTSSRCVPDGSDLDDCCSNAFALTDLSGLKWRKYVHIWSKVTNTSPSGDPVLASFSSALEQDILCSWRHSPEAPKRNKDDIIRAGKELWVFWFGEEPNFGGVVSHGLVESTHGCWEDGLTHEPRSLLFKALHNLLEKCLLSKKFIRLGRWFVQPVLSSELSESNSDNLSYSFSFFVHGESTVCTTVEIQQGPRVRHIVIDDLTAACAKAEGLQVILSPFGETGFLTGQSQSTDDDKSNKLLDDWSKFYPLDAGSHWLSAESPLDREVPAVVMVVNNEELMMYPSAYVMVVCSDDRQDKLITNSDTMMYNAPSTSISLTPPTSPADSSDPSKISPKIPQTSLTAGQVSLRSALPKTNSDKKKLTQSLVQDVWKGVVAPKPSVSKLSTAKLVPSFVKPDPSSQPPPGSEISLIGQPLWEFEEPFKRISCACTSSSNISRPKPSPQVRTSFGFNRPIPSPNPPLPSPQQQQQQQTQTTMKLKKEKKKAIIPFHHRPILQQDVAEPALKCYAVMATKGLPTVNSLTNDNQKRYSDCAGPTVTAKKYVMSGNNPFSKHSSTLGTSKVNTSRSSAVKVDTNPDMILSVANKTDTVITETANNSSFSSQLVQDELNYPIAKPVQNELCYLLPDESSFVAPVLPGNTLDCRLFQPLPSPPPLPSQEASKPFPDSIKRPLDSEDTASPPAKRSRRESSAKSTGSGRSRNESVSGMSKPRGRRNSSLQSPTFPIKGEDNDMDITLSGLKSPTQARVPRQRRRSSNSSVASPSIPSPAPIEPQKPSRPRQRRQSIRKQQQEEKERQLREQEEEHLKNSIFNSTDSSVQKFIPSPPTPRQNIPINNLYTVESLMVTDNDLDKLFDNDDDDDDDDAFKKTPNIDSNCGFHVGQSSLNKPSDVFSSSQTIGNSGVVASQDLARMFPTPPSLEPVAHSPPCSAGSDYISPGSVKTMVCGIATSPETHTLGSIIVNDSEHDSIISPKELGCVFEIPTVEEFPLSLKFGQVDGLPSQKKHPLKMPDNLTYKPHGQTLQNTDTKMDISQNMVQTDTLEITSTAILPSPAQGSYLGDIPSVSADCRHYTSLSPLSPASSISSFSITQPASKHKATNLPSKLLVDYLQHSSSISKVLLLSDSYKNYFSDKNFDNVNLCGCNDRNSGESKTTKYKTCTSKLWDTQHCTCGFLSLEQLKFSKGQGLFSEDELPKTALSKDKTAVKTQPSLSIVEVKREKQGAANVQSDSMFNSLVDVVIDQCSSPFSCLLMKQQRNKQTESLSSVESVSTTKAVTALHRIRQMLQEAVQKSTSRKTWEQPNGTMVQGPLSWKQFHQLAVKGGEETPKAQPIPSMLVGNSGDWISVSPFSFPFWEKLLLEPFSSKQDIAYVVVAPENDPVLTSTKLFFKELSSLYETCRLGQHVPIAKIRDGILRVGQKSLKLCKENVDEWFSQQSNTSEGARVKLYAQVCKYHLAPYLSTLKFDRHLLDRDKADDKTKSDSDRSGFPYSGNEGSKTGTIGTPTADTLSTPSGDDDHESVSDEPPTIVVYLVDPFVSGGSSASSSYVGLLRCFAEMIQGLTDSLKSNIVLQVIPLTQILQVDNLNKSKEVSMNFIMQLKCMAFSVFSRCRKTIQLNTNVKSLTGFGPAAGQEATVKDKEGDTICLKLYSCPYILDSPTNPVLEITDNSVEKMVPSCQSTLVLHCGYCLSRDQRWLLTVCTDSTGEKVESTAISVRPMLREDGKPYKTSSRTKALTKLFEFCVGVIASSLSSWRLVICKLGRMGQGEVKDWKEILSKTSTENREACNACTSMRSDLRPTVLGATVMALEPEPAVRLYLAKGLTKASSLLDSSHQIPVTTIPKPDVSRTYINVFSTVYPTKGCNKGIDKTLPIAETATETVITDTDFLLAGADDDENDPDPLRHLFPLLNTSPTPLSPGLLGSPMTSPTEENHLPSSSPLGLVPNLTASQAVSSPFQPIGRASPFQPVNQSVPSPSKSVGLQTRGKIDVDSSIHQPLAQGYVISTVTPGKLPKSFWINYPHAEKSHPVIMRASMFLHSPELMELANGFHVPSHDLNSRAHCDVLKYILQQLDALSWLNIDPMSRDRRSCLPVHLCMVSQLCDAFVHLIEKT